LRPDFGSTDMAADEIVGVTDVPMLASMLE
jgi:hypothetical protein